VRREIAAANAEAEPVSDQHGENGQADGVALAVHDDPEQVGITGVVEVRLVTLEATGFKEEAAEGSFVPMSIVQNGLIRNLVESIRQGGSQGGAIVKQFTEKTQEELKAFPVSVAFVETLLGDDPLMANLASPAGSKQFAQPALLPVRKSYSQSDKLRAHISPAGGEALREDLAHGWIVIVEELDQVRKLVLNMHR
jgi:hypothetical protein|tara:strand:- start:437 stop:1024 length:588 start_codon:yes stop_codon:yes gene_type:complete